MPVPSPRGDSSAPRRPRADPAVRPATNRDLRALAAIEEAADRRYEELWGPAPFGTEPAPPGAERAAAAGEVLVVSEDPEGPPLGFAHVLLLEGRAHLEQLSVLPEHQGRGLGGALIEAACAWAAARGHGEITLRTFADVPFTAPLYARHGFVEVPAPEAAWHRDLLRAEAAADLSRHGRRVLMRRTLGTGAGGPGTGRGTAGP